MGGRHSILETWTSSLDRLLAVEVLELHLLGKMALSVVLGGAIGLERELKGKPAGLRTNILICMGATLLTDVSMSIGIVGGVRIGDPARLAAQVISGVGFLGAGTIMHSSGMVTGLTSAATIWVVAAIGIAVGSGNYVGAAGAGAMVTVVLAWMGRLEHRIKRIRRVVHLTVRAKPGTSLEAVIGTLNEEGLRVTESRVFDHPRDRTFEFTLSGPAVQFEIMPQRLME
ncbi:MAG: MgtC/SapB family protein, partial [Gemmatimonadaceae bacterium]